MRAFFFLLCTTVFSLTPENTFSQEKIVIAQDQLASVDDVFIIINKQTGYRFIYPRNLFKNSPKVQLTKGEIGLVKLLNKSLLPSYLDFELSNKNTIIIKEHNISPTSAAQDGIEISGLISDNTGLPLPGANIIEKGTTNGTQSDFDGNYSIIVSKGAILVYSYLGYISREITIGENDSLRNIVLDPDVSALDEITVTSIGYGKVEKREITSSVVSVTSKKFNKGNVNDPAQLLQGKVAGLSIVKPGADPNAGFNIRLRGLSTFGANSQPLIVIDGVLGGSLQLIDPNDIESIEVLKDGSAAAIYGTRGASGVILVTTKKAKGSTARLEYNNYVALEEVSRFVQNSTPQQYIEAGGVDNGYETNWLDLLTRTGVTQVHNLSVSNGNETGSYRASVNYRDVEGIAVGSGFDQLNARFGLNQKLVNDRLNLAFNIGITKRNAQFIPYEGMRFAIIADPTAPIYIDNNPENGYWEPNSPEYHNPYGIINEVNDQGTFKTMLGNLRVDYEVSKNLSLGAFYSMQYESDLRSQYFSSKTRFSSAAGQHGRANKFTEDRNNELFEITGNYEKSLGKLKINLLGGYSWQEFTFENFSAFNTNFITDDLLSNALELGLGTAEGSDAAAGMFSQKEESRLISVFGRAMFNYDDTYFLSATLRREGSSKFGPNNSWGNFYSVSGGINFAKVFTTPFDVLKLRAGYGVTGNLPNQNYEYRVRLSRGARSLFNETTYLQGVNFASNPNPDLKWEEKAETNIGLDFGILNSKIRGSVDYYIRNTTDVLQSVSVPVPPNFYPNTLLNIGELKSNGLEIALGLTAIQNNDFTYNTDVTFSTYNTELVTLTGETERVFLGNLGPPGLNGVNVIKVAEGEVIGDIMAPIFEGLTDDGKRILTDQNGDDTINQEDWKVVGNGLPDFELSWNNAFTYKNFDLNMAFRGAFGHSLVNINRAYYESPAASNNYNPVRTKYYLPELTEGENWNSSYVEKADFFKLDNVTLGYNFDLKEDSLLKSFRLYASGQNLFVISGYTGVDPEVHYSYGSPLAPGIDDRNSYFRTRTITLGLNIGF
tara:strand:- start:58484 stop:61654 length:3171 start_codon:yes stop_codon:yes gene_type:complete